MSAIEICVTPVEQLVADIAEIATAETVDPECVEQQQPQPTLSLARTVELCQGGLFPGWGPRLR